ncbi:hypothetical protein ACLOJK_032523 [Asimina triloba]
MESEMSQDASVDTNVDSNEIDLTETLDVQAEQLNQNAEFEPEPKHPGPTQTRSARESKESKPTENPKANGHYPAQTEVGFVRES